MSKKHKGHKCLCPVCRKANKKAAKIAKLLKKMDSQFVTESELPELIAQYLASNPVTPPTPPTPASTPVVANTLLISWKGSLQLSAGAGTGTDYVPPATFTLVTAIDNSNGTVVLNPTGTVTVNTPGMYMFTVSADPTNLVFANSNGAEIDIVDAATQSTIYDAGLLAASTNYTYMFAGTVTTATEMLAILDSGGFSVIDATKPAIWLTIIQLT